MLGIVFLWVAYILFIATGTLYLIAQKLRDNSIIDIFYSWLFLLPGIILPFVIPSTHLTYTVLLFMLLVWGTRLSLRIAKKNLGKGEDRRYAHWRKEWEEKGRGYYLLRSYLQIFCLQGLVVFIVFLPLSLVAAKAHTVYPFFLALGALIWFIGFLWEAIADWQLDHFLSREENRGQIMTKGLFRLSRRPNYFGESVQWVGMAIAAASSLPLPYTILVFLSPALITYIVYYVTGPITERMWDDSSEYQRYKERTNYFFPWFPKKRSVAKDNASTV